jgi:predicted protein tyrosine phosphatase
MRKKRVLFVCTGNSERSPTAERLFAGDRCESRSAGTNPVSGGTPVAQELLDWADLILVMEIQHAQYILTNFQVDEKKVKILNVEDMYRRNDPELVRILRQKVTPLLERATLG